MTYIVGFTGTRKGMTAAQLATLKALLLNVFVVSSRSRGSVELHHGDCLGADESAYLAAKALGYRTVAHPPTSSALRAFTRSDVVLPKKPYLTRNLAIVKASHRLVACPDGDEVQRSGTWQTVRAARREGVAITVIYPCGTRKDEMP